MNRLSMNDFLKFLAKYNVSIKFAQDPKVPSIVWLAEVSCDYRGDNLYFKYGMNEWDSLENRDPKAIDDMLYTTIKACKKDLESTFKKIDERLAVAGGDK